MSNEITEIIEYLKNNLSSDCDLGKFSNILDKNIVNWRKHIILNKNIYCKNVLFRNEIFEVILISWLPRQGTKLHSHPKNGCLMKILYGELYELRGFDKYSEKILKEKSVSYMHNKFGKHIIRNLSNKPVISLHIYSPPKFYN